MTRGGVGGDQGRSVRQSGFKACRVSRRCFAKRGGLHAAGQQRSTFHPAALCLMEVREDCCSGLLKSKNNPAAAGVASIGARRA